MKRPIIFYVNVRPSAESIVICSESILHSRTRYGVPIQRSIYRNLKTGGLKAWVSIIDLLGRGTNIKYAN